MAPPSTPLSVRRVRTILRELAPTTSDLEALCIDFFPSVHRRFANGMDRLQQENLLLELESTEDIVAALQQSYPERWAALFPESEPGQPRPSSAAVVRPMSDMFSPSRWPEFTLVEPAQLPELRMRLLSLGEGLVVEGPSGVGKTTAVRQALREIQQEHRTRWLDMDASAERAALDDLLLSELSPGGYLVIDNFHHLDAERQRQVAVLIKRLSDLNRRDAKVTLIGINPVSQSLIDAHPDISGRYARIAMVRQPDAKVDELIRKGEAAANIEFVHRQAFVAEADGLFILAQRLCLEGALAEGVTTSQSKLRRIAIEPKDIADRVLNDLRPKFHASLLALATLDDPGSQTKRGASLKILWHLGRSREAMISLHELRHRDAQLSAAFDWLLASNLGTFFESNPRQRQLFHYDRRAAVLSADDPQLAYYLRRLSWSEFAEQAGFAGRILRFDDKEGPQFVVSAGERAPKSSPTRPAVRSTPPLRLLHLSDIHFGPVNRDHLTSETEPEETKRLQQTATRWFGQLEADLLRLNKRDRLTAVVITGDIADRAHPIEYQAAAHFLSELRRACNLAPHQLVLVPGNHDVDWHQSKAAYTPMRRQDLRRRLEPGTFIDEDPPKGKYIEVRSEAEHQKRFLAFANFYAQARGGELYALNYEDQGVLYHFPDSNLLILGLNSAWRIDHHFKGMAHINMDALSRALQSVHNTPEYKRCTKIAAWHHPLHSDAEDRIQNSEFMQQLATHGFQLVLHGHVHEAKEQLFSSRSVIADRDIQILGAGTFGARSEERPGIPLQYQLLDIDGREVVVHTRKREKIDGAWTTDARWVSKDSHTGDEVWKGRFSLTLSEPL